MTERATPAAPAEPQAPDTNQLIAERREKLAALRQQGVAFPNDFKEAATNFRIRGWQWWRQVMLPGIFPYYVTGAITASGGAWNASIVSEWVQWGDDKVAAHGLGAYIAQTTADGDYPRILLGIAVMALFVVLFNRLLWRPMYAIAENKLRLN